MEMAYLGLFQKIFKWVLNHIFDPVFKWLSTLLSTALSWLFNELLADILLPVLKDMVTYFVELFMDIFCTLIYGVFSGILKLIDYMEIAFDVFIGVRDDITFTSGGKTTVGTLLEVLFQQETVNKVFWILTAAGLAIAMLFTIYMTAKSAFDLDFDNRRPVSKVLASMMKTFVQFFTVPFFVIFIIKLSSIILGSITTLLNQGGETTLGRIIFVISSLNAAKNANYNADSNAYGIVLGTNRNDTVRYPFYSLSAVNARDYGEIGVVETYFDLSKFDYLIGFIVAIFLFFVLAACLLGFVQRIFEIILLYMISPYFVSTIPLDDGERFGKWRELFIGKTFSGFGSAIGMRLYLMVCPLIMGGNIDFGAGSSPEMGYLIKLLFLTGGAWAVYKSGPMLTQILSYQAVQSEMMSQGTASYGIHQATRQMYRGGKQLLSLAGSAKDALGKKKGQQNSDEKSAKYTGKENTAGKQGGSQGSGGGSSGGDSGANRGAKFAGSQKAKSGKSDGAETRKSKNENRWRKSDQDKTRSGAQRSDQSKIAIGSHRFDQNKSAGSSNQSDQNKIAIGSHRLNSQTNKTAAQQKGTTAQDRAMQSRLVLNGNRLRSELASQASQQRGAFSGSNNQNSSVQKITVIRETQIRREVIHVKDSSGNAAPRYSSYSRLAKTANETGNRRK